LDESGAVAPLTPSGAIRLTERRTVVVTGRGFLPNSEAVVWIFSTPTRLGVISVSGTGSYSAEMYVSDDLEIGEHTLQVNGIVPSGEIRSMNVALEILATDAPRIPEATIPTDDADSGVPIEKSESSSETDVVPATLLLGVLIGGSLVWFFLARRRLKQGQNIETVRD
jgi:hypothetical protein